MYSARGCDFVSFPLPSQKSPTKIGTLLEKRPILVSRESTEKGLTKIEVLEEKRPIFLWNLFKRTPQK